MVTSAQLAGVVVSSVVLIAVPGPSVMFIVGRALAPGGGRRWPQFVVPPHGSIATQMLMLSVVPVLIGIVMDSIWAFTAGAARAWFAHSPRRLRRTEQVGGSCIIALGVATALIPEKS
jgi:threonine/homoserine/homoserine lactone efflux protein